MLKQHKGEIGLKLPIGNDLDCEDSFIEILRFFTSLEASLSMDLDEGSDVDLQLLEDVSNATDEFNLPEGESIDIDDLNLRLMNSEQSPSGRARSTDISTGDFEIICSYNFVCSVRNSPLVLELKSVNLLSNLFDKA